MAVTGSKWLSEVLRGCYGVEVVVRGSTWLLRGLRPALFHENHLTRFMWDGFSEGVTAA